MDLSFFKSLIDVRFQDVPLIYYMHENQLTYPLSPLDRDNQNQDFHYGFINYKSCLAADHCIFNSLYHNHTFFEALSQLLSRLPDHSHPENVEQLKSKSSILPIGIDFNKIDEIDVPDTKKIFSCFSPIESSMGTRQKT